MAFIVDGEISLIDSPKNLKLQYGEKMVEVEFCNGGRLQKETLSTVVQNERDRLKHIIDNFEILTMHTKEATLEEIFIKVTGRGLV